MKNEKAETRPPKRSCPLFQHVLLVLFLTSLLWTLSPPQGPKTPTIGLLVSRFGGTPRNYPTIPDSLPPPRDRLPQKTRNRPPSLTFVREAEDKVLPEKTETIKDLSSLAPSTKEGGAEVEININMTNSLHVGGKLAHYQSRWLELFPQFPEIIRKISQGILIAFSDDAPTSPSGVTQQQQAIRPYSSCEEALGLPSHRRSEGHLVTGLLQSPLSSFQARRIIQTNRGSQEVKSISGHTFFQNGNCFLHHRSSTTTRMDYQDRPQRCLSSYPGPCEHPQVLCVKHPKSTKTLAPVVQLLCTQGIRVHAYLDDWIIRADSPEQSLQHTSQTIQLLQTLGWTINWKKSMLEPSRILYFLGQHFNLEQAIVSPPDSFIDSLTSVLSRLSTSTVMSACKISSITSRISHFAPFIHHGRLHLRLLQFWIKRHWSQHKHTWDTQIQLDSEFLTQFHCSTDEKFFKESLYISRNPTCFSSQMHF